ncbi:MAG: YlbF family regulator [Phycisphaerae bacterium]|jgi:cell fate (sporulation/competence/biofilm development) regulator YlbF (YheA/YmcA/DUF963 family)
MSAIVELANRLGKAIAESPQAVKMRAAREELSKHSDVTQLLKDYQAMAEKVGRLEEEKKPVEVADKHALAAIQNRLVASEVFKAYTAAQVDYIDMMRQVNQTLQKCLAETEK